MAIKVRRSSKRERFTDDQIAKIYEAVDELHPPGTQRGDYATNAHVRAFLMVLQYAALRIGDVCALRRSDITGDRLTVGRIEVETGKTGIMVSAVLPPSVLEALDQLPHQGDHFFMPDDGNLTVRKNKWGEMLGKVYKAARVPHRSHAWRDTLVFKLLQKGVGIDLVAMLLGHTDIRITMRHYAAWVPERQTSLDVALRSVW
jgi:integrase